MIFAELRREDAGEGYYTLRYCVWNDNMLGTYGVHFNPRDKPYGASRDYHTPATPEQVAAHEAYEAFKRLPDAEQDAIYDKGEEPYAQFVDTCCYWDNVPCHCDGSSLVEVIVGDDERAFAIAAMMADVKRQGD